MTPAPRLEMRGVRKRFGATLALDGVDLEVAAGECHALLGQNGAGKSTLMKVLSGAHPADEGSMRLDGEPYRPRDPLDARRLGVAMIYQELSLARHLSVEENMVLGLEPTRCGWLDRRALRRTAVAALDQLGHSEIRPEAAAGSLTIAQQQIVEIGRALAVGCRVLVLDEPTSSITRRDAGRLFELIDRLRGQGHAIVYISHFIEECKRAARRFTVLRDGRSVGGGDLERAAPGQIVDLMVGRKVDRLYPRSPRSPGAEVLSIDGLVLRRGEVVGIAGLVGAGRTEFLRRIFADPGARWSQGMGFVSEDRKTEGLALGLSVADNLMLSKLDPLIFPSRQAATARRWIETLAVACRDPFQRISELSGGNQQKIAIARLLHHDVDILLLDEPTRGIDVGSKAQIYELIDDLVSKRGKAAILVSSYVPELLGTCDRIAVMRRGQLGPARPVAELDERSILREATGEGAA